MTKEIIKEAIKTKIKTKVELSRLKRKYTKKCGGVLPTNMELLATYRKMIESKKIKTDKNIEKILITRDIRSQSGVAVVSVLTKPYPCPGKCLYCPTEKGMPKSYLSNEPAVMRAILNQFHPYKQVNTRLDALEKTGHPTDKIELIVIGGTWSYLPKKYQTWFIKECFRACNEISKLKINPAADERKSKTRIKNRKYFNLKTLQKINETAKHRIIGLTLETRPDFINEGEIKRMLTLGATRVELGAQSLYDDVLYHNHRGHNIKDLINATKLLKDAGFKICYHMMPGLPGSNIEKDKKMFKELFSNPDFQPDMLKIYPCVVLKEAGLYKIWKEKKYKPYTDKQLINLLAEIKKEIPYYVRINRLIRDIPSQSIVAGNKISNLRQIMKDKKIKCGCIRCREAGLMVNEAADKKMDLKIKLFRQEYNASDGNEIFLSYESPDQKILYAFLRLRVLPKNNGIKKSNKKFGAIIRELHTYGSLVPIGEKYFKQDIQHRGLGKSLLYEAEKIVKKDYKKIKKIAVISGVGVREYYKKIGYKLEKTYMVKNL